MAQQSDAQKATIRRVMHEFKHGELKSGSSDEPVENPRQAIAIALDEAGASRDETPARNARAFRRTRRKEAAGTTAEARKEGKAAQDETLKPRRRTRKAG